MKKILVLSMLVSSAMICSCQKQESAAEQQLAQRKVELDAREEALAERKGALDDREKALNEKQKALDRREKALAQREKAAANPTNTQVQTPDPAQVQATREALLQQFSAGMPERSRAKSEKDENESKLQEQLGQSRSYQEERLKAIERKWQAAGISGGAVFPAPAPTSPSPPPAEEATSPIPSPTPE